MEWLLTVFSLPENATHLVMTLFVIKRLVAFVGVIIIVWGAATAFFHFCREWNPRRRKGERIDQIRLEFGRTIVLGLEFIVAADVIETTTAPDYYSVGILASLVGIRTLLTYFMNRELRAIKRPSR